MAVGVDVNALGEDTNGDFKPETEVIPKGFNLCRLVSYIEMGHHRPVFGGKVQKYDQGKRIGETKDVEMMIQLVFEFTNAKYTGSFPLCTKTSSPFGDKGDLMSKLSISKGVEEGWCSRSIALKQNYVKTLIAMQDATKSSHQSLDKFVGEVFGCTITHALGKKADDKGNIPTYANMKTTSLVAAEARHPVTGKVEVYDLPEIKGAYCPVFDWESPTIEAWSGIPKFTKQYILKAEDYPGSQLEILLAGLTEGVDPAGIESDTQDNSAPAKTADPDPTPDDDIPF